MKRISFLKSLSAAFTLAPSKFFAIPPPPKKFVIETTLEEITGEAPALMASGRLSSPDSRLNLAFRTGGHGRGYLPAGRYEVCIHNLSRSDRGFVKDGVGFSFALSDKDDPRVGGTRRLLRIHPEASRGSAGCIALAADAKALAQFRDVLAAYCRAGKVELQVSIRKD